MEEGREDSRGDPRLRGGNPPHPHELNPRQMTVLEAVCETFVPSSDLVENSPQKLDGENASEFLTKGSFDDVDSFYRLSATDMGLAPEVAGKMFETLKPALLVIIGWVLWMLSTRIFTFLLFGTMTLSSEFPFFQSFPMLSAKLREKAMLRWAGSSILSFQKLFKLFKSYTLYFLYVKVDENGWNPCWNAIGYCGPDPRMKTVSSDQTARPLEGMVLDSTTSAQKLLVSLADRGFTILDGVSHLRSLNKQQRQASTSGGKREIGIGCDVVVVGSGSGGGVVAGVLAKAGHKVLVLEKGQYFAREDLTLLEGPSMAAMYESGGTLSTDDGKFGILAGSTVGGGSTVNWAASFQTPKHVRQEWAEEHGLSVFATEQYQQAMDTVCQRLEVQPTCEKESLQNLALRQGCEALGYDIGDIPRNTHGDHSCGWCNFGCKNGGKRATTETWLVDAVSSGSLILSDCEAQTVLHQKNKSGEGKKGRKAVGIVASFGEETVLYIEATVTVVACGSLNSPPLLLRSGLKNRNIGRNLHLHPVMLGWGYFPEKKGPAGTSYEGAIMTAFSRQTANWETSGYGTLLQVPILHPGMFGALLPWQSGVDHKAAMRKFSRTAHFLVLARDKGSGRLELDPDGKTTTITYSISTFDEQNLLDGLDRGLRAMVAAGAEEIGTHHLDCETFCPTYKDELEAFLQRTRARGVDPGLKVPMASAHQMGTCRMGIKAATSVVDETGETWEVEGLYLGDASVFPTASGVNPMITVQSIALCTAQNILRMLQGQDKP